MDLRSLECPVCHTINSGMVLLCDTGHSFCADCSKCMNVCPKCNAAMTKRRNYDMEGLIQEMINLNASIDCKNANCSTKVTIKDYDNHEMECKYRLHRCQGALFSKWKCNWTGSFDEILEHYKDKHPNNSRLTAITSSVIFTLAFQDFKDTQIVSFFDGKQLFYLNHKVDKANKMVYWIFQYAGPSSEAKNYTFEFEINKGTRKFKINDLCVSDTDDTETYFKNEDCVCLTFKQIKLFMDAKNDIEVRFRITNYRQGGKPPVKLGNAQGQNTNFKGGKIEGKSSTEEVKKTKIVYNTVAAPPRIAPVTPFTLHQLDQLQQAPLNRQTITQMRAFVEQEKRKQRSMMH